MQPDSGRNCRKNQECRYRRYGWCLFPYSCETSPPPGCKAECVIINAVECEPYLTADHRLMLEKADEVLVGVSILMKAAKVTKGYIGIENNKPDAIKLMN